MRLNRRTSDRRSLTTAATTDRPMHFEFATATRIIFGAGQLREIGPVVKAFGARALVVTGKNVERGVELAKAESCEVVIGFGGGSAIDAAKAIAALLTNAGEVLDYLEVIGRAAPLTHSPLPLVAIPTTAGAGAEVTRNAVLASPQRQI